MLAHVLDTRISFPLRAIHPERKPLTPTVIIATDDERISAAMAPILCGSGTEVLRFKSASAYFAYGRPHTPWCVLLGNRLADMSGLEFQRMLAGNSAPPIIFLSADGDIPSCVQAIRHGADDYLALPVNHLDLATAMKRAFERGQSLLAMRQEDDNLRGRWNSLTSREAEIMRYVVDGFLNKQTAAELNISENTVQVHRGRIMRKMRANSFASLVRMSLRLAACGEATSFDGTSRRR